jgi:hypothetical protein
MKFDDWIQIIKKETEELWQVFKPYY